MIEVIMCNKCGHEQDFRPHTARLGEGVERVYIACEKCKEQYTAHYTDRAIRSIQTRQRKIGKTINSIGRGKYQELWEEYEDNKQKLMILMFELKQRMETESPRGQNH